MTQNRHINFLQDNTSSIFSHISPISRKDQALLVKTLKKFRPNSKNYEDSWGYIIQATRYGGFKWYDKRNGSLIFFGRKSESDNTLVVPNFFSEPEYLSQVIDKIQKELKISKTILKNINPKHIEHLAIYGFRPYKPTEEWSSEARFDDQTYPQSIVNLKKVIECIGKEYYHLRKVLRKDPLVKIRKYRKSDLNGVLEVFRSRDSATFKGSMHIQGVFYTSHAMYPSANLDKHVVIDNATGKIIGFTATSEISANISAFVALIFEPGIKIASIWGIFQTLINVYKKGYKEISFGGSETEGTDTFVKRYFRPIELLEKTHLIYDPK